MAGQNFTLVKTIDVGLANPDQIVQHIDGWYARVRVQRTKNPGQYGNLRVIEEGVQPHRVLRAWVAECDADGNLTSDSIENICQIVPPIDGTQKIDWQIEKKRMVRHALDELLLARADIPDDEEVRPLTRSV